MSQQITPDLPNLELRPSVDSLVIEDDTPVDNFFSAKLQRLLVEVLYSSWASLGMDRPLVADADIGIFSSVSRPPIVPDVFVSLDVEAPQDFREKKNRTYFVWEFGKSPDVVIEIVSNKEGDELGSMLQDYARLGVTYYVVFDPLGQLGDDALQVFGLREGQYVLLEDPWLAQVGLGLTLWEGVFETVEGTWLRWCDRDGKVLFTGAERAVQAEAKAAKLAEQLRVLGIDPDD
ncbi:MAG: Uma2 family endonuclease [Cyanobacteria bacterium P01_A01_bin.15]